LGKCEGSFLLWQKAFYKNKTGQSRGLDLFFYFKRIFHKKITLNLPNKPYLYVK
jgi:hypothetical protein